MILIYYWVVMGSNDVCFSNFVERVKKKIDLCVFEFLFGNIF